MSTGTGSVAWRGVAACVQLDQRPGRRIVRVRCTWIRVSACNAVSRISAIAIFQITRCRPQHRLNTPILGSTSIILAPSVATVTPSHSPPNPIPPVSCKIVNTSGFKCPLYKEASLVINAWIKQRKKLYLPQRSTWRQLTCTCNILA